MILKNACRIIFCFFLLLNLSWNSFAEETAKDKYTISFDPWMSMENGGNLIYSGYSLVSKYEEDLFKQLDFREDTFLNKSLGILKRIVKYNLIDYTITLLFFVMQHEYFGHGSVDRLINHDYYGEPNYDIQFGLHFSSLPYPFFIHGPVLLGGSYAGGRINTYDELLSLQTGGSSGTLKMSDMMFKKFFQNGDMDYHSSLLFFFSRTDILGYILGTRDEKVTDFPGSHDFEWYLYEINDKYGYNDTNNYKLTSGKLKSFAFISLLDPMLYYSLWNFYHYLYTGNEKTNIHLISIGEFDFLPTAKIDATPWGLEYYFDLYVKHKDIFSKIYYRHGQEIFEKFYGFGLSFDGIKISEQIETGFAIDYWHQPIRDGGNVSVNGSVSFGAADLIFKTGYKTSGYLLGEDLHGGLYINLGIRFEI